MRVYGVESDCEFREYEQLPFQEKDLEEWLKKNPDSILQGEQLMLVGSPVQARLAELYREIDLLGVDREGRTVIVELKRGRTPRNVIAQALEYAAIAKSLTHEEIERLLRDHEDDESVILAEHHRSYFRLAESNVAFNTNQRIVIMAQEIATEIRETASFLESKGVLITCVEFSFSKNEEGPRLLALPLEEVVGRRRTRARSTPTILKRMKFLGRCKHEREVFEELFEWFDPQKGFSTKVSDTKKSFTVRVCGVIVCYCYRSRSSGGPALHTGFSEQVDDLRPKVIAQLRESAERTGLFRPSTTGGPEWTIPIDESFTESSTSTEAGRENSKTRRLLKWFAAVHKIIEHSQSAASNLATPTS